MYIYSDKHYLQSTFYTNIKTQYIISDLDSWESVEAIWVIFFKLS